MYLKNLLGTYLKGEITLINESLITWILFILRIALIKMNRLIFKVKSSVKVTKERRTP
jgi:hypothetical protein